MACSWAAVQWWRVASPAGGWNVLWTKTLRGRWCSSLGAAMTAPPALEQDRQQGRQQVNLATWRTYCFHGRPHNDSCIQMISRFSRFCLLRPLSMALLCNLPTTTVTIQSTRTPAHPSSPPKPGVSSEVDRSIWTGAKIQLTDPVPSPFGTVRLARFEASAWARQPHCRFLQLAKNKLPRAGCCPILTP